MTRPAKIGRYLLVAFLCSLAACAVYRPERARMMAAQDFECPTGQVDIVHDDEHRVRAWGCGKQATYYCDDDSRGVERCERYKPPKLVALLQQAAQELNCEPSALKLKALDNGRYEVRGCERRSTYRCADKGETVSCQQDTEGPSAASASPTGTPPAPQASAPR